MNRPLVEFFPEGCFSNTSKNKSCVESTQALWDLHITLNPILSVLIIPMLDRSVPLILISGSPSTRLWVCILYTSEVCLPGPPSFLDITKLFPHIQI